MLIIILSSLILIIISIIRWLYALDKRQTDIEQHLREIYKNIR